MNHAVALVLLLDSRIAASDAVDVGLKLSTEHSHVDPNCRDIGQCGRQNKGNHCKEALTDVIQCPLPICQTQVNAPTQKGLTGLPWSRIFQQEARAQVKIGMHLPLAKLKQLEPPLP